MSAKLQFILMIFYYLFINSLQQVIIKTEKGSLIGTILVTKTRKISAFLGIPYATPPIGDLRFKSPEPLKQWSKIRLAQKEGNVCPQMNNTELIGDEDCLYLNIFTPFLQFKRAIKKGKLLPVMFFIHGGGYYFGSSSPKKYGPRYLLEKDIILVTFNYRLGIFGFLTTGDIVVPGNFGLKDQVLALKWVKKYIHHFGGNPKNITIFGESAGATSVSFHAISDSTNGLFQQYIIESGSGLCPWVFRKKENYKPYLETVEKNVGCSNNNSEVFVNCLRKKNVTELLNAYPPGLVVAWVPTDEVESKDAFLTDSPQNLISRNKLKKLPSISGTVGDEGLIVTSYLYNKENISMIEVQNFIDLCINLTSTYDLFSNHTDKFIKTVKDYYFNDTHASLDTLLTILTAFVGDSQFLYPQSTVIDQMTQDKDRIFYFYSFNYFSPNMRNIFDFLNFKENVGVPHAAELSYLFSQEESGKITNNDEKIINLMVDLWTTFAIEGKPKSNLLEDEWLPYGKNSKFLQIGNMLNNTVPSVTLESNYFSERMHFWKTQFPLI